MTIVIAAIAVFALVNVVVVCVIAVIVTVTAVNSVVVLLNVVVDSRFNLLQSCLYVVVSQPRDGSAGKETSE